MISRDKYNQFKAAFDSSRQVNRFGQAFVIQFMDSLPRSDEILAIYYCASRSRAESLIEDLIGE